MSFPTRCLAHDVPLRSLCEVIIKVCKKACFSAHYANVLLKGYALFFTPIFIATAILARTGRTATATAKTNAYFIGRFNLFNLATNHQQLSRKDRYRISKRHYIAL